MTAPLAPQGGPQSLTDWIRYLHNAASVPKDSPDYGEAQQAVEDALLRIRHLNRSANQMEQQEVANEDPGALATFAGAANATMGEGLGGTAGMALGAVGGLPPQITMPLGAAIGKRLGLNVSGTDEAGFEEAEERHPLAGALGTTAGVAIPLAAGGLGGILAGRAHGRSAVLRGPTPGQTALEHPFLSREAGRQAFLDRQMMDAAGAPPRAPSPVKSPGRTLPYHSRGGPWTGSKLPPVTPDPTTSMAQGQLGVLQQYLAGASPEEIPQRLAAIRALGVQLPPEAETILASLGGP